MARGRKSEGKSRAAVERYNHSPHGKRKQYYNVVKRFYGLTPEAYDAMVIGQCGRCAACSEQLVDGVVDHCHKTGLVRGVICLRCNWALGNAGDSPDKLRKLAQYLDDRRF